MEHSISSIMFRRWNQSDIWESTILLDDRAFLGLRLSVDNIKRYAWLSYWLEYLMLKAICSDENGFYIFAEWSRREVAHILIQQVSKGNAIILLFRGSLVINHIIQPYLIICAHWVILLLILFLNYFSINVTFFYLFLCHSCHSL